ncbi:MAG: hypothetical protein WHX52_04340, partial [Anaerolineae bacterium]
VSSVQSVDKNKKPRACAFARGLETKTTGAPRARGLVGLGIRLGLASTLPQARAVVIILVHELHSELHGACLL